MSIHSEQGFISRLARLPWPAALGFGVMGFAAIEWGLPWAFDAAGTKPNEAFAAVQSTGALGPLAGIVLFTGFACAALSWLHAARRTRLREAQHRLKSGPVLTWETFKHSLGEAYRQRGFEVEEQAGASGASGGIDLVLTKNGETTLVQCNHWRSNYVGVSVVRELADAMDKHRAAAGKLVCAGVFSSDCYRFAVGKAIELVDGEAVSRLVAQVRAEAAMEAAPMS